MLVEWNGVKWNKRCVWWSVRAVPPVWKHRGARRVSAVLGEEFQVDAKLDPKGRLVLPARLRKKLEAAGIDSLVLMYNPQFGAVMAYTPEDFRAQVELPLRQRSNPLGRQAMLAQHALLANATAVDLDNQGRLNVPPLIRDKADLTRDLVMHTVMGRLEIWNAERWAARLAAAEAEFAGMDLSDILGVG